MTQEALAYLTQKMNHLICIHAAICQTSVIMVEFKDLHNRCKRVMSNEALHFQHIMMPCTNTITYFKMRWWTQLLSWLSAIRMQCTSTKQWKHQNKNSWQNKDWELIPRDKVPKGTTILPSVWSMKCKRDMKTQQVYKHKARLNVHHGKQVYGENYFEIFALVVTWFSIWLLVLLILNKWHTRQVNFVLLYTQADIEFNMYMELPAGIETKYGNGKTHVLKLLKNLYGQKQAGQVWNQHLTNGLKQLGFKQSKVNACVFFHSVVIFVYNHDGIFASPNNKEVDKAINDMKTLFNIDDQGNIKDYLSINVEKLPNGDIKLTQPHLIIQIITEPKSSCHLNLPTKWHQPYPPKSYNEMKSAWLCLPKYGLPMSRWMRTSSLMQNSCGMRLQFLASAADCDWVCLRLLMAYQLMVKEVGRIMLRLNASWAGLAFKVVWNVVLMAHITGMRQKFLLGRYGVEVLSDEATGM